MERDIRRFTQVTKDKLSVQSVNRGLTNFVTGAAVEPDVAHDLLNARTMGQKDYEIAVQFYFFKNPSIKFQKRKRKLLTFTNTQKKKEKTIIGITRTKDCRILHQTSNCLGTTTQHKCRLHWHAIC